MKNTISKDYFMRDYSTKVFSYIVRVSCMIIHITYIEFIRPAYLYANHARSLILSGSERSPLRIDSYS
jgi:hypothetical protein